MSAPQSTLRASHSNLFRLTNLDTVAVPMGLLDALLADPSTKPTTIVLFLYLLRCAAKGAVTRLRTGDILNDTGLSRSTYTAARDQLGTGGYISTQETDNRGVWQYEILGMNGSKLPTYDQFVVFKELPDESIAAYYAERLGNPGMHTSDGLLLFTCPFHKVQRKEKSSSFRVTLKRDHISHGAFFCTMCSNNGGLIWFEQSIVKAQGRQAMPTKSEAARSIRNFMKVLEFRLETEAEEQLSGPEIEDIETAETGVTI